MDLIAWWRGRPVDANRWLVVDVETSGLVPGRDRLLAIAAVAVRVDWRVKVLRVVPGDSFEVVLRQDTPSERNNVLLHGIGMQRQRDAMPGADALRSFAAFAGASPLLAFHAAFDEAMIGRACREAAVPLLRNPWLDIEHLCGATHPEARARSLDEWLAHFGIRCAARHRAAADALAEADLLLRIWPGVAPEVRDWRGVERVAASQRWLARG